jgi:hypothetical protein
MANDKCMYGCRRIPTTPEFGDVCNQCMKVFYLGMMEYKQAIARVRKWHYKATSMFHVEDVEICATCSSICPHEVDSDVYWPCDTIRALDGEQ